MMSEAKDDQKLSVLRKVALPTILGAIVGFGVAFGVLEFGEGIGETGLSASAEIAVLCGAFYVIIGLFVGGGTLVPGAGAKLLNVEDADELREQRSMLLLSSYALALWGAALIVLALSGEEALIAAVPALIVAAVLYALGLYFVVRSYALSDELMVAVNREAAVWSYGLVFAFLGGWSALAHAGILPGAQPLDVLSVFYGMVLIATFIAAGRRGMLKVR